MKRAREEAALELALELTDAYDVTIHTDMPAHEYVAQWLRAQQKAAMERVIEAAIQRMQEREWRWERFDFDRMLGAIDALLDEEGA